MLFYPSNVLSGFIVVVALLLPALGLSQSKESNLSTHPTIERIHRGDVIEIDEMGGFDFDWRGKLTPEGYLEGFAKVAEPIYGLCSTTDELAERVRQAYSRTLRDPKVSVRIIDQSDRPVAILDGAVRQPMRFSIRRDANLVELVALSGGLTHQAGGEVTVFRPEGQSCEGPIGDESSRMLRLTVDEILSGDPAANPKIASGDLITVQAVLPFYVIGGVNRPGKGDWRAGLTVARAVAIAGGVSDRGVAGRVSIYRRDKGGTSVVQIDLDRVSSGEVADVELKPYDILDVPLKGSDARMQPPVVEDLPVTSSDRFLPLRVID